jgi:hypothetical protein
MRTGEMAKRGLYIGIGAGLVLFVLAGLLPGSLIGGVIGLKFIEAVFGGPMTAAILPRIILAVSMIMGVMASAAVCILGPGLIGWGVGYMIDSTRAVAETGEEAHEHAHK